MARTSDAADYMVTQCQACGMLNVIPREYPDGRVCADCSGGPLIPMGYAILQERPTSRITVQVDVERDQMDRLIDDVAAVNDTVDGIIQKIGKIKRDNMKQEQIIKRGGQKTKAFNCDLEKNTQCDKEFYKHNINAIDGLCDHTTNPNFALELERKHRKKAYTPGRKN